MDMNGRMTMKKPRSIELPGFLFKYSLFQVSEKCSY